MTKTEGRDPKASADPQDRPAGEFSSWLRLARRAAEAATTGMDVPCGECTACCRGSYFIHIRPEEKQTLARIPKALLFPAPGLPKGNVLMGYNERGECPMFRENRCSIYEYRPRACRDYDCRVLAAAGIALEAEGARAQIAERARRWRFDFADDASRKEHAAVRAAATFLEERRASFPPDALPSNPAQLAALAVRVYEIFLAPDETAPGSPKRSTDAEIARAVMAAMDAG